MKKTLTALALLTALPFAASAADGVSYNYVDAGYVKTESDGGNADGWGLKGSFAVAPNFHVFGDYNRQEIDHTNIDVDQWRVGVGYNKEVGQNIDLLTRIAYNKFDAGHGADWDGYSAEAGIRGKVNPVLEGYVLAGYEDYTKKHGVNPDGEFYGRVGVLGKFNANWGVTGEVKLGKGGTREWYVGPRYSW